MVAPRKHRPLRPSPGDSGSQPQGRDEGVAKRIPWWGGRIAWVLCLFGLGACGGASSPRVDSGFAWDLLAPELSADIQDSEDRQRGDLPADQGLFLDERAEDEAAKVGDGWDQETPAVSCRSTEDCLAALGNGGPCREWDCRDGTCIQEERSEASPCDDGNACTTQDVCRAGRCMGAPVQCPEEPGSCTGRACDPARGCVEYPRTGDPCDDQDACTAQDRCLLGACRGQPVLCDDEDACTEDFCEPDAGCRHRVLEGGACDDGEVCTRNDRCASDGSCRGEPDPCDDGNPCTEDACSLGVGCRHRPLHGPACDDGSACTADDHCQSGQCSGERRDCRDGNPCTQDLCDDQEGCVHPPEDGAPCHDGNPCTDQDFCLDGLCQGSASACDDGNPCTRDTCTLHSGCAHQVLSGTACEDGDACTIGDICLQGTCVAGGPRDCDDQNPCTADRCDRRQGCLYERLPGASPCDDGDACTAGDRCIYGRCVGEVVSCDDQNPCTGDSCDPRVGCVYHSVAGPCDDGDPCTAGDSCREGVCRSGTNPQCLAIQRIVLAGDSWSSGFIQPLREALDARGYEEVTVSWELTSKPGSTVAGWLSDAELLGALAVALDMEPPAGLLLFTLGGNDYLAACRNGLGRLDAWGWYLTMARIQADLQAFVDLARARRPHLRVVILGYDYLNYLVIQALGFSFPGMDMARFNLGLVELASRGRAVGEGTPNTTYAHNMGLLQFTFGDALFGYGPGAVPRPGPAPGYDPFPGGWWTHPSPAAHIPDGIHPDPAGFRALIENSLDQGPAAYIEGRAWP